ETYDWPGNIRELKNFVERCLLLGQLPDEMMISERESDTEQTGYPDTWSLEQVEYEHIVKVVASMGGNKNQAAKLLGVSSKTLYRKLRSDQEVSDD
ncbi:MAG: sigma-54-dependent Fis family transcriptional regulator, partial [Psychrosphaera sp.]|nr:sigma-54-dependent Fis family transcriptional regulator [Psychrosphaera sp.]